jgi:hypothetical protein
MDLHSEHLLTSLLTEKNDAHRWTRENLSKPHRRMSFAQHLRGTADRWGAGQMTIALLPDDILLEIFAFYVEDINFFSIDAWHTLVHVCRKWRVLVFGSPRRLNLRLQCGTGRKPVRARETLDIWPPLPIVLWQHDHLAWDTDNIMAALEHNDRVCEIKLWDASSSQLEKVLGAMQEPFPALTNLLLRCSRSKIAQVIPNSFLGGSAPRLRELTLDNIAFPGLRKLLLTTTHLVELDLWRISHSGYISPEAMVTFLSTLTRLERLRLKFQSPQSRPDRESRRPSPLIRSVLPALTYFRFKGVSEYLEDFVERIDAPMLEILDITLFHQLIFDTPNLPQFISRTPTFKARDEACVVVSESGVRIAPAQPFVRGFRVDLEISCGQSDWQLSSLAQVCRSSFPHAFISSLENLYIREDEYPRLGWQDDTENAQWLDLLHPFTAVKNLYLSKEFTRRVAPVLQELVGERVVETLPALQCLFLEEVNLVGPVQEAIEKFVAARQLSNHPIAVSHYSHWDKEQDE